MAAHPIVVVDGGTVQIPAEYKGDPRFQDGASLELVPVQSRGVVEPVTKGDWRKLDGILAGETFDTTAWKRQEREWELAHDERKFGVSRPTW
jgi:hypothetical protein